jgi:hypothetical protein
MVEGWSDAADTPKNMHLGDPLAWVSDAKDPLGSIVCMVMSCANDAIRSSVKDQVDDRIADKTLHCTDIDRIHSIVDHMKVTHINCDRHSSDKTSVTVTLERCTPDDLGSMLIRQAIDCAEANIDHTSKSIISCHHGLECGFTIAADHVVMPANFVTVNIDMDNVYTDHFPGPNQVAPPIDPNLPGAPEQNVPGNTTTDALLQTPIGISQHSAATTNVAANTLTSVMLGQAIAQAINSAVNPKSIGTQVRKV